MRSLLCVAMLLLALMLFAQPTLEFQRLYGGTATDNGYNMDTTLDGGYIIMSRTTSIDGLVNGSHGELDLWIVKLDTYGEMEWQRCLGGSGWDSEGSIRSCADGGYILTGATSSSDGDVSLPGFGLSDIWVVKLTATGDISWQQRYGGTYADSGHRIVELDDGGFVLLAMAESQDGNIIGNHGGVDLWLAWLNSIGEIQHSRCFGGSDNELLIGDLCVLANGNVGVTGATHSNDGDVSGNHFGTNGYGVDTWVFCASPTAGLVWQRCLGGTIGETGKTLAIAPDGTLLIGSRAESADGDLDQSYGGGDLWIVRLSETGELLDQISLGGTGGEVPWDIEVAANGDVYVLSQTNSSDGHITEAFGTNDAWLCKLSPELDLIWQKSYGGANGDFGRDLVLNPDGSLCFAGSTSSTDNGITGNYGSSDLWVVKLGAEDVGIPEGSSNQQLNIAPNPATNNLQIAWEGVLTARLEVFDALGRSMPVVLVDTYRNGTCDLDVADWSAGLYTVHARSAKGFMVASFLKQ